MKIIGSVVLMMLVIGITLFCLAGVRGTKSNKRPIEIFNDMDHQDKVKYQVDNYFFKDGYGSRVPVTGTVPLGFEVPEAPKSKASATGFGNGLGYFSTGRFGDFYGSGIPEELGIDTVEKSLAFLEHGQQQYEIYCAICHGDSGNGKGVVSKHGFAVIADLHQQRLIDAPDGDIYNTIVNGKGLMGAYGTALNLKDRWSVISYLRALQGAKGMDVSNTEVAALPGVKAALAKAAAQPKKKKEKPEATEAPATEEAPKVNAPKENAPEGVEPKGDAVEKGDAAAKKDLTKGDVAPEEKVEAPAPGAPAEGEQAPEVLEVPASPEGEVTPKAKTEEAATNTGDQSSETEQK